MLCLNIDIEFLNFLFFVSIFSAGKMCFNQYFFLPITVSGCGFLCIWILDTAFKRESMWKTASFVHFVYLCYNV